MILIKQNICVSLLCFYAGVTQLDTKGWQVANGFIPSDARVFTVSGVLLPAKSYEFRVTAVNSVGRGTPSPPTRAVFLPEQRKSLHFSNSGYRLYTIYDVL